MFAGQSSVLSVKDLNQMVKDLLADAIGQVWLMGEISNFSKPSSGHWYFTLKDDLAQVRCAMFRNSNFRVGFVPENGQQVLIRATVTLYEARGEYQLVVDKLQPAGAGLLQQKFELLKQKLQSEGLFETFHKKPLPDIIQTVGIVTSSTGAALHDVRQILARRDPNIHLIIYPTLVQGNDAAPQIAKMINLANARNECDVLIVGRGGGSLEDLWPFNEEIVARAIFASQLPIISAVGHEVDFTIADFVADLRAATPSAAAEIVSKDKLEQVKRLQVQQQYLSMAMDYFLMQKKQAITKLTHQLQQQHPQVKLARQQTILLKLHGRLNESAQQVLNSNKNKMNRLEASIKRLSPQIKLANYQQRLQQQDNLLHHLLANRITQAQHHIALLSSQLHGVSPLATLGRGYSITTTSQNQVIHETQQVNVGDTLITRFKQGRLISQITDIQEK